MVRKVTSHICRVHFNNNLHTLVEHATGQVTSPKYAKYLHILQGHTNFLVSHETWPETLLESAEQLLSWSLWQLLHDLQGQQELYPWTKWQSHPRLLELSEQSNQLLSCKLALECGSMASAFTIRLGFSNRKKCYCTILSINYDDTL